MSKPDVTFVNAMTVSGFLNGNVNLTFTTARFSASGDTVMPDEYESLFLRMDLYCAQQVHAALGEIIAKQTKPKSEMN